MNPVLPADAGMPSVSRSNTATEWPSSISQHAIAEPMTPPPMTATVDIWQRPFCWRCGVVVESRAAFQRPQWSVIAPHDRLCPNLSPSQPATAISEGRGEGSVGLVVAFVRSLPGHRRNPAFDAVRAKMGYDRAWRAWSEALTDSIALAERIGSMPASSLLGLAIKFDAILWSQFHDSMADSIDADHLERLQAFGRELHSLAGAEGLSGW